MFHTILTPLDGSTFGEHALPLALAIARHSGAGLRLLNVQAPPAALYSETPLFVDDSYLESYVREHQRAMGLAYLDGVVKRLKGLPAASVTPLVAEGEVRDVIRAQAECVHADLVVMTTHGRGPFGRFWLGSVADELVRTLPMPVLLVRPREAAPDLDHEAKLKHVLIALDGSPFAEQIVEPAVELGALMGAAFTLIRIAQPVLPREYALEGRGHGQLAKGLERLEGEQSRRVVQAENYLDELAARLRARSLTVQTRVMIQGEEQPAVGILQQAQHVDADLVALATHGRRGLSRLFLGSVADKVLRGGRLPLLLVRPKDTLKE